MTDKSLIISKGYIKNKFQHLYIIDTSIFTTFHYIITIYYRYSLLNYIIRLGTHGRYFTVQLSHDLHATVFIQ